MSQACKHCGIQIHSNAWHSANFRLQGVWPGTVRTESAACITCGHGTYYAAVNRFQQRGWTGDKMDLARFPSYRPPKIPNHALDVWYVTHPLPLDSQFHQLVLQQLERLDRDRVFIVTEDRFEIDVGKYAGHCVADLSAGRDGPYPNVYMEWTVSTSVHNRLGKQVINTFWPSYFRPGFEYHSLIGDGDLFREFSYDLRRTIPIEIKVNP